MFNLPVECPHCGNSITHNWRNHIVSSDVIDDDRGMGSEREHTIECEEFECPNCGKTFSVTGSIYEYPEGALNYYELETRIKILIMFLHGEVVASPILIEI